MVEQYFRKPDKIYLVTTWQHVWASRSFLYAGVIAVDSIHVGIKPAI
jgi:hypothetical protein